MTGPFAQRPAIDGEPSTRPATAAVKTAVLIPCFNEAITVGNVVRSFRRALPNAEVHVYDNNSTDDTAEIARAAGASVTVEKRQGKGWVLAAMFRDIYADIYVLVDGDDTYPAESVHALIEPIDRGVADMVVANRLVQYEKGAYRRLHVLGNRLVAKSINLIFGSHLHDVMSGYRCFSRTVVESIPIVSRGFEVETELTVQSLYRGLIISEVPVAYGQRPEGSQSKLSTFRDGARVLLKIVDLFKAYRPLLFFGVLAILTGIVGLVLGAVPTIEFLQTGRVLRFPTAILAAALEIVALVFLTCGLILDSIKHHFRELSQILYQTRRPDDRRTRG